MLMLFAKNYQH